jgi:hypothetical protein
MANAISDLKTKLGAGLRPNKYQVSINTPSNLSTIDTLCKSTSFPQKTIGQVEVWSQGRKAMLQGETEYDHTWDVTFYETEDHSLREEFIAWMQLIDNTKENLHEDGYMDTAKVAQLNGQGDITAEYEFTNLWPQVVSTIEVADETVNTVGEFTVTFSFDYWEKIS